MPEHGWIGVCHSPLTGITRNPWNPEHTPGGSTGGGAVAALLGLGVLHLGTDGAGSLRIPAAFTGVFGMKPSFGRVPIYPAVLLNVLSHQGPITRTVADAALMLSVIAQPDARDMTAWNTPAPDFSAGLDDGVRGLRVALSTRLGHVALDPEIEAAARKAARALQEQGAIVEEADPPLRRAPDRPAIAVAGGGARANRRRTRGHPADGRRGNLARSEGGPGSKSITRPPVKFSEKLPGIHRKSDGLRVDFPGLVPAYVCDVSLRAFW